MLAKLHSQLASTPTTANTAATASQPDERVQAALDAQQTVRPRRKRLVSDDAHGAADTDQVRLVDAQCRAWHTAF